MQGGSFAYLTPAFALIGQVIENQEALGLPKDAEDGVNHERFLVRPCRSEMAVAAAVHLSCRLC